MFVDDLARRLTAGEVPIGILTALIGAPVFAVLLRRGGLGVEFPPARPGDSNGGLPLLRVDLTDVLKAGIGDEKVLLGRDGTEEIALWVMTYGELLIGLVGSIVCHLLSRDG